MTPCSGNRYLVSEGLKRMNASASRTCRIINQSRNNPVLSLREILPGRLRQIEYRQPHGTCSASYELLMTDSVERAGINDLAGAKNTERQQITAKATVWLKNRCWRATGIADYGPGDIFSGISGLVANKLSDEFYRRQWSSAPVKKSVRSCRSIPEFNLIDL